MSTLITYTHLCLQATVLHCDSLWLRFLRYEPTPFVGCHGVLLSGGDNGSIFALQVEQAPITGAYKVITLQ